MAADLKRLEQTVLAVASYRQDEAVLRLLEQVEARKVLFGRIVLVDSQSSGALERKIAERSWTNTVRCCSAETNLGSAGNLAQRLRLAGETNLDWVYAINHDGEISPEAIAALVEVGEAERSRSRPIGAVYPLRRMSNRGNAYDVTGRYRLPLIAIRSATKPEGRVLDVYWSSSNGALYALEPVRKGLLPWADLWMGYEDLGYGWLLHQRGYRQLLATDVVVDDSYEYRHRGKVWVTDKPSWYAYYHARNFLLVAERTGQPAYARAAILGRLLLELGISALFRDNKRERFGLVTQGMIDGLLRRTGKYKVP